MEFSYIISFIIKPFDDNLRLPLEASNEYLNDLLRKSPFEQVDCKYALKTDLYCSCIHDYGNSRVAAYQKRQKS